MILVTNDFEINVFEVKIVIFLCFISFIIHEEYSLREIIIKCDEIYIKNHNIFVYFLLV